uniref:Cytochrome P450 n=2 Tax=Bursaphelenchus xylophilus TaxID=6326 RepID=A0A1I7RZT0_BURXY
MLAKRGMVEVCDGYKAKYGNVFTFWAGEVPVVMLNTLELADEYMVKQGDVFADRMKMHPITKLLRGGVEGGVVYMSGDVWRNQRRFALKVMRDFGLGKSGMEDKILSEALIICERLSHDIDAGIDDVDMKRYINLATGSVINTVVCGEGFTAQNEKGDFHKVQDVVDSLNNDEDNTLAILAFLFPILLKVPYVNRPAQRLIKHVHEMIKCIDDQVEDHLRKNDYSDQSMEPRDFIDAFMLEKARVEANGEERKYFTKEQLRGTAIDLWFAGHDTTNATMNWIVSYLIQYQDIQEKLHEELDRVISSDRPVRNADRPDLPYLQAFLTESQRMANIIPVNIPRATTEDVNVEGYNLKKGTLVIAQIATIMRDPKHFPSPLEFRPERFINENGKFVSHPAMLPFSLGKRVCLGEGLARMELYLFTANLLNQFKILPGKTPPTLKKIKPSSFHAALYTCKMEKRY